MWEPFCLPALGWSPVGTGRPAQASPGLLTPFSFPHPSSLSTLCLFLFLLASPLSSSASFPLFILLIFPTRLSCIPGIPGSHSLWCPGIPSPVALLQGPQPGPTRLLMVVSSPQARRLEPSLEVPLELLLANPVPKEKVCSLRSSQGAQLSRLAS